MLYQCSISVAPENVRKHVDVVFNSCNRCCVPCGATVGQTKCLDESLDSSAAFTFGRFSCIICLKVFGLSYVFAKKNKSIRFQEAVVSCRPFNRDDMLNCAFKRSLFFRFRVTFPLRN